MVTPRMPDLSLQSLIDSHTNPFVRLDENYTIVAANKAYCDSYGTSDDMVVGHKCHMFSHYFDTTCFMSNEDCPHAKVLETGQCYEVLHIHFDAPSDTRAPASSANARSLK